MNAGDERYENMAHSATVHSARCRRSLFSQRANSSAGSVTVLPQQVGRCEALADESSSVSGVGLIASGGGFARPPALSYRGVYSLFSIVYWLFILIYLFHKIIWFLTFQWRDEKLRRWTIYWIPIKYGIFYVSVRMINVARNLDMWNRNCGCKTRKILQ